MQLDPSKQSLLVSETLTGSIGAVSGDFDQVITTGGIVTIFRTRISRGEFHGKVKNQCKISRWSQKCEEALNLEELYQKPERILTNLVSLVRLCFPRSEMCLD